MKNDKHTNIPSKFLVFRNVHSKNKKTLFMNKCLQEKLSLQIYLILTLCTEKKTTFNNAKN